MISPFIRPRRLRTSAGIRKLVRETELNAADFVYPLFIVPGQNVKQEIPSLPGNYHLSADMAVSMAAEAYALAGRAMVENMMNPDTDEGICAFLEKRPPNWR